MNTGNASSARAWRHRLAASGELGRGWKVLLAGFGGNALGAGEPDRTVPLALNRGCSVHAGPVD